MGSFVYFWPKFSKFKHSYLSKSLKHVELDKIKLLGKSKHSETSTFENIDQKWPFFVILSPYILYGTEEYPRNLTRHIFVIKEDFEIP